MSAAFNFGSAGTGLERRCAFKGISVTVKLRFATLAAAVLVFAPGPVTAQDSAAPAAAPAGPASDSTVEGATADRVALVNSCAGHKFETMVEIDPVKHRSTRVKLCAKPGSTDADWVKTLNAAIDQIEQRNMPASARDKLIAELQAEIAQYAKPGSGIQTSHGQGLAALSMGKNLLAESSIEPEAPFETSSLPPLASYKAKAPGAGAAPGAAAVPVKPMRATMRCLERGETGKPGTCDFFDRNTVLAFTAIAGLESGATIRFLRRGEEHGTVDIPATGTGQTRRVPLPSSICKGLSYSKVEVQILAPGETRTSARFGPYGLRC